MNERLKLVAGVAEAHSSLLYFQMHYMFLLKQMKDLLAKMPCLRWEDYIGCNKHAIQKVNDECLKFSTGVAEARLSLLYISSSLLRVCNMYILM